MTGSGQRAAHYPQLKILVALATYNERGNLPALVQEIADTLPGVDILVVDDNSPDGTGAWVVQEQQTNPRLKLISRSGKLGLGTAVLAAMKYAVENRYDYLVNMDADGSHRPQHLPALLQKVAEGYDVVIGSRYIDGGQVENWTWRRRWASWCINQYARWMLGLKTHDNSGSFRCYRIELLRKLDTGTIISSGYSFFEEMLYRLAKLNATFAEVPITFVDRRSGNSKINEFEAFNALWVILRIRLKHAFS
jgi:dolichol-phosphate mannosyltransferase